MFRERKMIDRLLRCKGRPPKREMMPSQKIDLLKALLIGEIEKVHEKGQERVSLTDIDHWLLNNSLRPEEDLT